MLDDRLVTVSGALAPGSALRPRETPPHGVPSMRRCSVSALELGAGPFDQRVVLARCARGVDLRDGHRGAARAIDDDVELLLREIADERAPALAIARERDG